MATEKKPPSSARRTLLILAAVIVVFACGACGLFAALSGAFSGAADGAEQAAEQPAVELVEAAPTDEPQPTEIPPTATTEPTAAPSATPAPTATPLDPEAALRLAVEDILGDSNRDIEPKLRVFDVRPDEGSISLSWAADDNFSADWIVKGMQQETAEVLEAIDASGVPYEWVFIGITFGLVDQFGNESESDVVTASYSAETIERINFDNFQAGNVFEIADTYRLHPALQP